MRIKTDGAQECSAKLTGAALAANLRARGVSVVKTSELTGPALDWAVAKAGGRLDAQIEFRTWPGLKFVDIVLHGGRPQVCTPYAKQEYADFAPSTDWAQGGPIIEREGITIRPRKSLGDWSAFKTFVGSEAFGPTPLIAAMRCYVASKLGDEVDVPEELA